MNKLLITGGTGLIGSAFIQEAVKKYDVYSVQRNSSSVPGVKVIPGDLGSDVDFSQLPDKIDTLIYLAQSENFRLFPEKAEEVFRVNTVNLLRFLDYARKAGAKKVVYASSGGVYGNATTFSESSPIIASDDLGFYLSTKLCSEILTDNYKPYMDVVVLRFFFVYGAGQRRSMLIPRLVDTVKEGREISLSGEAGISINPTHVTDAVRAIERSLDLKGSHKINVAGPEVLSLRDIGEIIGQKLSRSPLYKTLPNAGKDVIGDVNLMTQILGAPQVKFADGVMDVL